MTTKNAAKKNAAKKNAAAKLALVPKKPVQKVAVKKVAPKAAMVKHTKAQVAAVERNRMDPQLTLIKATNTNPRREGSWGFQSFAVIKNGMTIEQAKAKGARAKDIAWDIAHGNLKLGRRA